MYIYFFVLVSYQCPFRFIVHNVQCDFIHLWLNFKSRKRIAIEQAQQHQQYKHHRALRKMRMNHSESIESRYATVIRPDLCALAVCVCVLELKCFFSSGSGECVGGLLN